TMALPQYVVPTISQYKILSVLTISIIFLFCIECLLRMITHLYPGIYSYGPLVRWSIGPVLVFLTACELLLRRVGSNHPKINQLDPLVGWRPRAGIRGIYGREGDSLVDIVINSAGYRDSE